MNLYISWGKFPKNSISTKTFDVLITTCNILFNFLKSKYPKSAVGECSREMKRSPELRDIYSAFYLIKTARVTKQEEEDQKAQTFRKKTRQQ